MIPQPEDHEIHKAPEVQQTQEAQEAQKGHEGQEGHEGHEGQEGHESLGLQAVNAMNAANDLKDRLIVVVLAVTVEGGLIGLAFLLGWFLDISPVERFVWSWLDLGWGLLGTVPMLVLFFVLTQLRLAPLERIRSFLEEVIYPALRPCSWFELVVICVLAGLGEELFFRGLAQGTLSRYVPGFAALILASVLFGLVHMVTLTYAVIATFLGAYLGWLWEVSGNLLVPIIAHTAYDLVLMLWLIQGAGRPGAETAETQR